MRPHSPHLRGESPPIAERILHAFTHYPFRRQEQPFSSVSTDGAATHCSPLPNPPFSRLTALTRAA